MARFAEEKALRDEDDNEIVVSLLWAYLDDVHFIPKKGVTLKEVLDWLESDEVQSRYHIRPNREKSWAATPKEMEDVGRKILGSWVGGPNDASSPGGKLTINVAERIQDRIQTMEFLCLHDRITLLRLCWFPTLNHLLRTLKPRVGIEGTKQFDQCVRDTLYKWMGDYRGNPCRWSV